MLCQQNSAGRMSLPALYGFMVLLFLLDPGDQTVSALTPTVEKKA